MTLPFSGFCHRTIQIAGNARMRVLDVVRAECNRNGVLHGWSQRRIAKAANNMSLRVCHQALHEIQALGIWTLLPRQNRRQPGSIVFHAEHWCYTAEKPAPERPSVSPARNTKSKAREERKNPPVTPQGGASAPVFSEQEGEGAVIEADATPEAPDRTSPTGSTRRTPYGQPRAPRRPRPARQRQRKTEVLQAFRDAAVDLIAEREGTTAAKPADRPALPPPSIEVIPPDRRSSGDAPEIEMSPNSPRQSRPGRRGFTPATDTMEAFYYAALELIAERTGDCSDPRRADGPLLAA